MGNDVFCSPPGKWRTFHDFLLSYIRDPRVLGGQWAEEEMKKSPELRHPLFDWAESTWALLKQTGVTAGKISQTASTGASSAFLGLAYNLYLIAHNTSDRSVQESLIRRLKRTEEFLPTVHETRVAAALIHAGFSLRFEDETDVSRRHCELVATYVPTGNKFSVEAKLRRAGKATADVGNQLHPALTKPAAHARVIFIELNAPDLFDAENRPAQLQEVVQSLRTREEKLTINGEPAPPAYLIITNNPYEYSLNAPVRHWALVEGFKIPDFRFEANYASIREARLARDRHIEIHNLTESLRQHVFVPMTFDGEIAELASEQPLPRLTIGKKYNVDEPGKPPLVVELLDAHVWKNGTEVCGICRTEDGRTTVVTVPADARRSRGVYKRHPRTFFGRLKPAPGPITNPLEVYDSFYAQYKDTPKEKLLEWLHDASDFDTLKDLSQTELAEIICERWVYATLPQPAAPDACGGDPA